MASDDTLLIFTPHHNDPPSSDYARLGLRNNHLTLKFKDSATNESAVFSAVMPRYYSNNTGVTVYLHYAMETGNSNTIDWDVAFERIGDQQQNIDSDGFASIQSTNDITVPGTSGLVDIISIAFTAGAQMDSVVAGEGFRIKITRDGASDSATGDAELLFVELKET